jgi:thiol:disulfide interchange protein
MAKRHPTRILAALLALCLPGLAIAQFVGMGGPFAWRHEQTDGELRIVVEIPDGHYLYEDTITVTVADAAGGEVAASVMPEPVDYDADGTPEVIHPAGIATWRFPLAKTTTPYAVRIAYQGCRKAPFVCFMPGTIEWQIMVGDDDAGEALIPDGEPAPDAEPAALPGDAVPAADWRAAAAAFEIGNVLVGYVGPEPFLRFLDEASLPAGERDGGIFGNLRERGMLVALLLVLIGGLALNLTPCVLPMIPVNLAIIGAGAQAGSRRHGFLLGGAYGFGIMAVYGLLGTFAVVTGATFGTLNASPAFNLAIALVFVILALAMFDVFTIDFSRFQRGGPTAGQGRGRLGVALAMGGVSALLAGACVAPVVIAVLLHAATLHAEGNVLGLLLPFVLGLGMALPWPFAGAGLSLLPRPGAWMVRVKQGFGVLILAFAAYYGWLGYTLMPSAAPEPVPATTDDAEGVPWRHDLGPALAEAARDGRPVVIDVWASWCKNCLAMERTTLRDPAVQERLRGFVPVKFRAEDPRDPETKAVLDHFGVLGLPTFLVLLPNAHTPPSSPPGKGQ